MTEATQATQETQAQQTEQAQTQQTEAKTEQKAEVKTETKTEESFAGETEKKAEGEKKAEVVKAPDAYTEFKLPEGFKLEGELLEKASALFKAQGLSQEQAQSFMDFHTAQLEAVGKAPFNAYKATQEGWLKEIAADPEIGGKQPEVKATISKFINTMGPQANAFREAMNVTGAGNHPAVVKALYHIAQQLGEGGLVRGNNPSPAGQKSPGAPKTGAERLWPNLATGNQA